MSTAHQPSAVGPATVDVKAWGWRYTGRRDWACRGVDLHIEAGERVLLVGPSGAGKSTLLHGVAGLLDPETAAETEGVVTVNGTPAQQGRQPVGVLFQDPESSLVMSRAGDDVAFGLENDGVPRAHIWPRVRAALDAVGFGYDLNRSTAALSGGEKQRLALAGALVRKPGLLVLDEPTANLDPSGTRSVLTRVESAVQDRRTTVLMVEHQISAAMDLVDRVVVLSPDGVYVDGSPADIFARHGGALTELGVWVPAPWGPAIPRRRAEHASAAPTVLTGTGITHTHPAGSQPAITGARLDLDAGRTVALTGRNGSGKSTLVTILAGLVEPDHGDVRLTDQPERPLHRWRAARLCRRVGTVFQQPEHQFVTARVDAEVRVGPRRAGLVPRGRKDEAGRCDELLERLRLEHLAAANPFTLSGGEKRRLSVATALATAPDVLVLDEPTFGQDARTWLELLELCARLRDEGTALLAATHDEAFVDALADRRVGLS